MIKWLRTQHTLRDNRKLVANARKLIRINRDILDSRQVSELTTASDALAQAVRNGNLAEVTALSDKLTKEICKVFPPEPYSGWRENVEVFLVAAIVAMAVRSFFLQPFKIPTGSMQPTLYGIYPYADTERREPPLPYIGPPPPLPIRLLGTAFLGRMYESTGYRTRGDHVFVDRFTYHFRKPRRGDVVVFDTQNITMMPPGSRGKFYIKRLIGLEGDTVQIRPPYVLVDGKILDHAPAFKRIYAQQQGYTGYSNHSLDGLGRPTLPNYLSSTDSIFAVPPKHCLVLGDNTLHSFDGRYWGAVPNEDLIGRAVLVYWPFSGRFGPID